MAGKGGGAWKVAYADFVTAMMAFFLVMWITGQSKPIKESVAQYFNDPFGGPLSRPSGGSYQRSMDGGRAPHSNSFRSRFGPGRGRGGGAAPTRKPPKENPEGNLARKPSIFMVHGGEQSYVGAMLLFSTDSVALDEKSRAHLDEIVPAMIGKPNKIEIRGHSSGRALPASGEFKSVWGLCFARCQSVMDYLRDHGIKAERMRLSQAGPYEPQSEDGGPGLPAENSRVEVYMLSEYVDDLQGPGIEDGDQQDGYEDLRAGPIDPSASSSDRRAATH